MIYRGTFTAAGWTMPRTGSHSHHKVAGISIINISPNPCPGSVPGSCVSVSSSLNTTSASSGQAEYYEAGCFPLVLAKLAGDVLMVLGRYYLVHLVPECLNMKDFFPISRF